MVRTAPKALGIEAASFWSIAEKDIAESPTAKPERTNLLSDIRTESSARIFKSTDITDRHGGFSSTDLANQRGGCQHQSQRQCQKKLHLIN